MRGWEDTSSSHWTVPHREELLRFSSQLQKNKNTDNTNSTINFQNWTQIIVVHDWCAYELMNFYFVKCTRDVILEFIFKKYIPVDPTTLSTDKTRKWNDALFGFVVVMKWFVFDPHYDEDTNTSRLTPNQIKPQKARVVFERSAGSLGWVDLESSENRCACVCALNYKEWALSH